MLKLSEQWVNQEFESNLTEEIMKLTVFIATSLDGFIARKDDNLDWLMGASKAAEGEEYGYNELMASIDYLVMGRSTFETVAKFPDWPYKGKRLIVVSKTMTEIPEGYEGRIDLHNGSIEDLLKRLQSENCRAIYVDGGKTIQSFLKRGLVSDLIITKIPVLIGEGKPLFGVVDEDIPLKLIEAKSYESGFVRLHYQPKNFSLPSA